MQQNAAWQTSERNVARLRQWQEFTWLLIAFITPLFVNLWTEQQFEASKVWLLRTLIWLLGLLWLAAWLNGLRTRALPAVLSNLLTALMLTLLLATLFSSYPYIAIFGSLERAQGVLTQLSYLCLFLTVAKLIDPERSLRLLHVAVITATPICLLGLAQAVGWGLLPALTDARSPLITTLGRANFTGAYLVLLLPLTATAALQARSKLARYTFAGLFAAELLVVGLTQARAAWLGAVVGLGLLYWLRRSPGWPAPRRWLTLAGGAAACAGLLAYLLRQALATGGSIAARWTIWGASWRLLWPRLWLGYGADTLELYFPAVYPPELVYYQGRGVVVDRAHNWLLDWSLNYGIAATILLLAIILVCVRAGWQVLVRSDVGRPANELIPGLPPPWLAASLAAVLAHLVATLFLFEVAATATLFWLLLAIIVAAVSPEEAQASAQGRPYAHRHLVLIIGILIWSGAVWFGNGLPFMADSQSWQGSQALVQGQPGLAQSKFAAAAELQPGRAAYHVAAGLTAAELGRFPEAEQALQTAVTLRPTDPVVHRELALIYAQQARQIPGRIEAAYAALDQAIRLAPTLATTYQMYAEIAYAQTDLALARRQAEQAVALDATAGRAYAILGWTLLEQGELFAAVKAFEDAVVWEPESANAYYGLATAAYALGDLSKARQAVAWSLRLNPTYAPALTLQLQLLEN